MASLDFPSSSSTGLHNSGRRETWYLNQYLTPAAGAATSSSRTTSITDDNEQGPSSQCNGRDEDYIRVRSDFIEIRKNCQELGLQYVDVDFPPTKNSLVRSHPTTGSSRPNPNVHTNEEERFPSVIRWLRPGSISFNGRGTDTTDNWQLISDSSPSDIRQGMLI